MKFKNLQTSEVVNVSGIKLNDEKIVSGEAGGRPEGKRFCAKWSHIIAEQHDENGAQYFTVNDGWQLVRSERKAGTPKAPKAKVKVVEKTEATPVAEAEAVEVVTGTDEPVVEPVVAEAVTPADVVINEPAVTGTDEQLGQQLVAAIKALRGNTPAPTPTVDEEKVVEIFMRLWSELAAAEPKKAATTLKLIAKKDAKKTEVYCNKFDRILARVARGKYVYLHGPAGSGKSHTAEQVAELLGLDFYGQTTVQFAHDVRGYGDAGGNFIQTPFFKAFANGGLYFQDEYDRSNAEAAIVLNTALANGWYDFPVVGRVTAHPNFRFMAAGNSLMSGPDEEYVTAQQMDASSRDRFNSYFEVGYSHEVELHIAEGNEDIVAFVEDVRQAIAATGVKHVVSYRATAAMVDEVNNENDKVACCEEAVFKGLLKDERAIIYGALNYKTNVWAEALKKTL